MTPGLLQLTTGAPHSYTGATWQAPGLTMLIASVKRWPGDAQESRGGAG